MITIIFAPPRTGKTAFMTYLANEYAFNESRNCLMKSEIRSKIASGFSNIKTIPLHCVSANYDMIFKKFRYIDRYNRRINPYRLGFANNDVKTHYTFSYEVIFIQEAQKYLNSRMSMYFPEWQSRWYEQHGHNNIDIFMDTQRPMLIDVNIRELAQFVEIVNMENLLSKKTNKIIGHIWTIRKFENSGLFDKYMSSGKRDAECYSEEKITANYNVFRLYNSRNCAPKFYDGHFDEDIDYLVSVSPEESLTGYIEYLNNFDDELPEGFYKSRSLKKEKTY